MAAAPPPLPQGASPPADNWLMRNWKWLVPSLVFVFILVVGAFVAGIFSIIHSVMHSNGAYLSAIASARANPQVQAQLGAPIAEGWLTSGNIREDGAGGYAELAIPIEGPKAKATIYLKAEKSAGDWKFSELEVRIGDAATPIDLLAASPESAQDDPAPWLQEFTRGLPIDAAKFVSRVGACQHYGGEPLYDKARAAEVERAMARLECATLDADEARIRARFADNPAVLAAIDRAKRG